MKSKFLIKIKKLIAGRYFSTFQSIFKWSGLEVTDVRKYSAGDPFKYINRKQTAKHSELYTSLFQQEKDVSLDVFFDVNYNRKAHAENVMEFFADIIVYCQKNGIRIKLFWPPTHVLSIDKHRERAYESIDTLMHLIKKSPKIYRSHLSKFLEDAKKNTKRRAIVIFSDFLDVSENDMHTLHYFMKEHAISLVKIPVDSIEGQNYNGFVLDQSKERDSKKLQTITL